MWTVTYGRQSRYRVEKILSHRTKLSALEKESEQPKRTHGVLYWISRQAGQGDAGGIDADRLALTRTSRNRQLTPRSRSGVQCGKV